MGLVHKLYILVMGVDPHGTAGGDSACRPVGQSSAAEDEQVVAVAAQFTRLQFPVLRPECFCRPCIYTQSHVWHDISGDMDLLSM